MCVWFITIGGLGLKESLRNPEIFLALNPANIFTFFYQHGHKGIIILGSVVLCITGCEALYADLGHFGRKAIQNSWYFFVFPSLVLNYLGQGALLLSQPGVALNPFYGLVPKGLLYPMVALSTTAAVIASQALITGAFSLTHQAVQMGYCPRLRVFHTSSETRGQIYIPLVNYALMVCCIGVVLAFRGSSGLAGAYGIAVTGTMTLTSVLYGFVLINVWKRPLLRAVLLVGMFLIFDLSYFGANLLKFFQGGWFPLAVAAFVMTAMTTWKQGRYVLSQKLRDRRLPIDMFLKDLEAHPVCRVRGTAVFLTFSSEGTPPALLHHLKHNLTLHSQVVLLTLSTVDAPVVKDDHRVSIEELGRGFYRVVGRFGYMEQPHVPKVLELAGRQGLSADPGFTTYFMGRETILTTGTSRMSAWRKAFFAFMSRNAQTPMAYFGIPPNRVVEIGAQIEI
jgi:KUP system potassium uptake protein